MTARDIITALQLQPHPIEGGYFRETYRSGDTLAAGVLPRYASVHSAGTAIYYLLTPETFSAMHRLPTDEVFHFYLGGPVEMLHLYPDGSGKTVIFGNDIASGQHPQVVVPAGVWQGCSLLTGGGFALMGTTMAPGFEYADYETGLRQALVAQYPRFGLMIRKLTRG